MKKARECLSLGLFGLLFLGNALAVYAHNRLNAFLYLLLLGGYILLHSPYARKGLDIRAGLRKIFFDFADNRTALNWFFAVFAANIFALYYLDFGLLLVNLGLDALLTGCLLFLAKNKE
ncbi:MAG: hypothetical protein LBQ83_03550 [Candidatus Margulisbacteria bacterium]|jgi:hypothetical protein|nr:hypothetical protein [Candidatus Margulisiibacteriota bacterium]